MVLVRTGELAGMEDLSPLWLRGAEKVPATFQKELRPGHCPVKRKS